MQGRCSAAGTLTLPSLRDGPLPLPLARERGFSGSAQRGLPVCLVALFEHARDPRTADVVGPQLLGMLSAIEAREK